jgi:purine-binding chemotaxis protein CheW
LRRGFVDTFREAQAMNESQSALVFAVEKQRFALWLEVVQRVVRAVEVTPLPRAPEVVLGVINFEGQIIPVMSTRVRLGLPGRDVQLDDHFIIARTGTRTVTLVVDEVCDVVTVPETALTGAEKIVPGMEFIEGVMKLEGDLVLVEDLEKFLSLEQEKLLDEALKT